MGKIGLCIASEYSQLLWLGAVAFGRPSSFEPNADRSKRQGIDSDGVANRIPRQRCCFFKCSAAFAAVVLVFRMQDCFCRSNVTFSKAMLYLRKQCCFLKFQVLLLPQQRCFFKFNAAFA